MVPNLTLLLTFLLAALCVGGLLFAILQPYLASADRIGRRTQMVLRDRTASGTAHGRAEGKQRRA